MNTMRATVFHGVNDIRVEAVPVPRPAPGEALIRITLTTICGTDVHIVRGEYPVKPGLIIGHEPVGVIEELGRESSDMRSAIGFWLEPSLPADSAARAFLGSGRSAGREKDTSRSEDGVSAIPSTARKRNICWFLLRKPILPRFLRN